MTFLIHYAKARHGFTSDVIVRVNVNVRIKNKRLMIAIVFITYLAI